MTMIAAIDIGYRNTKFYFSRHPAGPCDGVHFPSIAVPASTAPSFGQRDTRLVEVDGEAYEVGRDVELIAGAHAARALHEQFFSTPQYHALYLGALSYIGQPQIDVLVAGLPSHLFEHRKTALRQRLEGNHHVPGLGAVNVNRVVVLPQPLGALSLHLSQENTPEQASQVLIVDPGFFTVDWTATSNGKCVAGLTGSHPTGLSAVLEALARLLEADFDITYRDLGALDRALAENRLRVAGTPVDAAPYLERARTALRPAIEALRNQVGDAAQIDAIVVAGGGAAIIEPLLRESFPRHSISLLPDPMTANARGFYLVGQQMAQAGRRSAA